MEIFHYLESKKYNVMNKIIILIFTFFLFSCTHKKTEKRYTVISLNVDSIRIESYLANRLIKKPKQLKIYCWCISQSERYGHCTADPGLRARDVIKKNQLVFSTKNKQLLDTILYNMITSGKVMGIDKYFGDARLAINIENEDSTFSTIGISDFGNHNIVYNDTILINLGFNPIEFINRVTGIKNIECEAN